MNKTFNQNFVVTVLLLLSLFSTSYLKAQSNGDYRTISTGNWTNTGIWEIWAGSWVAATSYPGQLTPAPSQTVNILHAVTLPIAPMEDLGSITGATNISSAGNSTLRYQGTLSGTCTFCYQVAVGDYRSSGTGNWSLFANYWEKYDGTTWATATDYPGQNAPVAGQKTFIRNASNMLIDLTPANSAGALIVEAGGTMTLSGCALIPVTTFTNNSSVIPSDRYAVINNGDYRSVNSGNWSTVANWQVFSGGAWIAASNYPGQVAPSATQNVIVRHNMTANVTVTAANNAGDVFVTEGVTITNTNSIAVRTIKNCGILTNPANMVSIITNYRSNVAAGTWSSASSWQVSTDGGSTWVAAFDYPGASIPRAGQVVTIQSGHNITLDISPSEDIGALTVTGTLSISGNNTLRRRGAITITGSCGSCGTNVFALNTNDVRTAKTNNWNNTTTAWERYNGTTWVDLASYPGLTDPGFASNVRVFIRSGHTMTIDVSPAFAVGNNMLIETGSVLATTSCENLEIYTNNLVNYGSYIRNNGTIATVNAGDFRSNANGNWSSNATWQKFVGGTGWTAAGAGEYPGTLSFIGSDVFIRHAVTLDLTPIEDVRNLVIESGASLTTSCNTNVRVRSSLVSCAGTITNNGGSVTTLNGGDFRSTGAGGNWNATGSWQVFDGTTLTWGAAATTPGAGVMLASNTVFIRSGSPITATANPTNNIPNLTIENGATLTINNAITVNSNGRTNLYGTLNLVGTGVLNYANAGDYRSKQAGTWGGIATWERYNGSAWINSTDYPGQNTTVFPRVTIAHAVTADVTVLGDLQNIVVTTGALTFNARISFRARASAANCASCNATNYYVLNTGDYRTTGSGNWSALGTWERYSGCAWVAATEYPGQTTAPVANTRIFVRTSHNPVLNLSPCEDISQVVVENGGILSFNTGHGLRARTNIANNGTFTANGGLYSVVANGDFRSLASGNWDANTSWQVYNSGTSTWSNAGAGVYPGVNTANANTNVYIRCGHVLALNVNPAEDVNNLLVENGSILNANATCNMMTLRGNATFSGTVNPNAKYSGGFDQFIRIKNGDYRTNGAATAWTTAANWEQFSAGVWSTATNAPGATVAPVGQNIVVRHNMTFGVATLANPIYNIFVLGGATLTKGSLTTLDVLGRDVSTASQCGTTDLNAPSTAYTPTTNPARYNISTWYRTNKASGSWNNSLDWDFSTDNGGSWNAGTATSGYPGLRAPTSTTTEAQILNGHIMNVNISPEEDIALLRIFAGGTLRFPNTAGLGYNLKVWNNGTAGTPNVVNGGTIDNINTTSGITGGTINTLFTGGSITSIDAEDYRTTGTGGNWSSVNTWQIFNASRIWATVPALNGYPGQNAPGATQSVIIRSADAVNMNIATPNDIGELVIENTGTLTPAANSNVNIRRHFINHGTLQATNGFFTFNNTTNGVITGAASLANYQFNDFIFGKSGGTLTTSRDFGIVGDWTNSNSGSTFTASSTSTVLFNGNNAQVIGGTGTNGINFFNLQIDQGSTVLSVNRTITATNLNITNNAKVSNNSTITVATGLLADGFAGSILTNNTGGVLEYNGTAIPFGNQVNRLDATAANNTVIYNRGGAQGVYPTNYAKLTISNNGTKTIDVTTNNFYVSEIMTVSGSGTIFTVNGTTGRLLNQTVNLGQGSKYVYNANASTTPANNLLNYNGPGAVTDGPVFYASNFSGRFNNINASNHSGNAVSTSNLRDIRFNLGTVTSGSAVYGVRNVNIPDVPTSAIVRFDVVGSVNGVTVASAAKLLIGNGFTDDNAISGNIAGRLDFNFRTNNELSITTSSTSASTINNTVIGNFASNTTSRRKSITWAINTSGGSLNYTAPNGTTESVANNRMDIWDGTTRVANDIFAITNGATMNNLKFVLDAGVGSITLENIRINPFAVLNTNNYTNLNSGMGGVGYFNQNPLCVPVGTNFPISSVGGTDAQYTTTSPASFVYNPGNQFQVQLSGPTGSFSSFTTIGSVNSTTLNSAIPLTIPPNIQPALASGSGFRIRIISTDPPMIAQASTSNLLLSSYSVQQYVSGSVSSPTVATLPAIQAITTTAPNQLSLNMIVTGINASCAAGNYTYQWRVRKVSSGNTYNITGATARNFQADGTRTNNAMVSSAGIHFPEDVGVYELFCTVTSASAACGCSTNTQSVRIAVECAGCTKNPRPYAACPTNLVFNGTFDVGGSNPNPGTGGSGTAIYPSSVPDPNDPNSEGIIPFDGSGGFATPNPGIGFPTAVGGNAFNVYTRAYTTATFSYLSGTSTFRFNTPYGFSTEYGGVNTSNFNTNMGLESAPGSGTCNECTMCPENTWSVTTNPGLYHGNFCDANGTNDCWRGNRASWTSTVAGPSGATSGSAGPPFINSPANITTTPGGLLQFAYNAAPSGARMLLANGSPFSAGKMWAQRFKVRKNTDYVFSFWASNMNDVQAIYGVFANCTQIGNNLNLNGQVDRCVWKQYTFLWNSGELDNVEFSIRNISTIRSGNDFAVDDIMFYRCTGNTNFFPTPNKFVWRGFNTDWFNADNWGNCAIPDCDSDVTIPATSTNPAAQSASSGQTYYFPIIQESGLTGTGMGGVVNPSPNTYATGHPGLNGSDGRNIPTANLASVKSITIEYGASFNGNPAPSLQIQTGWNLNVCGNFVNSKDQTIPIGNQQAVRANLGSSITFTSISTTQQVSASQGMTAQIIGNWTDVGAGQQNNFATLMVRKKAVDQIVQLQDDIDVYGDFAIENGTFDGNGKYFTFGGENFVNGADLGKNINYIGNGGNATDILGRVLYNTGASVPNPLNTLSGASFDHGLGTVEFNRATALGDQLYYRYQLPGCTVCDENFYNLIINQPTTAQAVDLTNINRGINIENTLDLRNGNILSSVQGAKDVYLKNPLQTSLINGSANSYIVTTNTGFTPTEENLKFRREIDNAGNYNFPVGGLPGGRGGTTEYRLLSLNLNNRFPDGAGSIRGYFDTRDLDVFPTVKTPPNGTLQPCMGTSLLYRFQFCTGGYWDLTPIDDNGNTLSFLSSVNYNLTMPSIPGSFGCSGTVQTMMKRSNDAGDWGYDNSCYVSPSTRNGFTSFSKVGPITENQVLPVEFVSFDAVRNNQTVDVKWETISERNASHFMVQRSMNGKDFVDIGRVEAKGNSTISVKYLFNDPRPSKGLNYYRLQQVDLDGKVSYTKMVLVDFEGTDTELQVFPNPSSEGIGFNIILPTSVTGEVEIKVNDAAGREMIYKRFRYEGGVIQLPSDFAKGFYTLSISTQKENYVRKLVVK